MAKNCPFSLLATIGVDGTNHVTPPNLELWNLARPVASYQGTQFRLGSRVGCLVMGPYARTSYVSKKQHSHVSLIRYCETLFALPVLNQRDRHAADMSDHLIPGPDKGADLNWLSLAVSGYSGR